MSSLFTFQSLFFNWRFLFAFTLIIMLLLLLLLLFSIWLAYFFERNCTSFYLFCIDSTYSNNRNYLWFKPWNQLNSKGPIFVDVGVYLICGDVISWMRLFSVSVRELIFSTKKKFRQGFKFVVDCYSQIPQTLSHLSSKNVKVKYPPT